MTPTMIEIPKLNLLYTPIYHISDGTYSPFYPAFFEEREKMKQEAKELLKNRSPSLLETVAYNGLMRKIWAFESTLEIVDTLMCCAYFRRGWEVTNFYNACDNVRAQLYIFDGCGGGNMKWAVCRHHAVRKRAEYVEYNMDTGSLYKVNSILGETVLAEPMDWWELYDDRENV